MGTFTRSAVVPAALCGMLLSVSSACAFEYPWCAQYSQDMMSGRRVAMAASPRRSDAGLTILAEDGTGARNCGFLTREQCMAAIAGMGGSCERNLFYRGEREPPPERPRRSHRR